MFYFVGLARIANYTVYKDPLTYIQENFVWIRTGQPVGPAANLFFNVFTVGDFVRDWSCVLCYKGSMSLFFAPYYCDQFPSTVPFFCEIV